MGGERHHHGRQAFVTGGDADHAAPGWQRTDQPPQDNGGIIAISQAVHHAGRSLGATVAWIADKSRKGDRIQPLQFFCGSLGQQTNLPVPGMITQGNRCAVGGANAALGAEDQKFRPAQLGWIPAHGRILGPAEYIATGCFS